MTESLGQSERPALYGGDPHSLPGKPLFVFHEKGVEFDLVYSSPSDLRANPAGTLPSLVHRGHVFTESTPLCEYIDKAFAGPSLTPDDPQARYRMRHRCRRSDHMAAALSAAGRRAPSRRESRKAAPARFTATQFADARARIGEYVTELETELTRDPWLAGDAYSLADILTFADFYALPEGYQEFATESFAPYVLDWLRRIYARPATAKTFSLSRSSARRAFDIAKALGSPMAEPTDA